MSELVKALVKARQRFLPIVKDRTNPHYKSRYATLDSVLAAVQPGLDATGLAIIQTVDIVDSAPVLITELIHESGESKKSVYPLPANLEPQKLGSAISYGRRYSVCAILSVTADEDDDGNGAINGSTVKPKSNTSDKRQALTVDTVAVSNNGSDRTELENEVAELVKTLGFTAQQASAFIAKNFPGKSKRSQLSVAELKDLLELLIDNSAEHSVDFEKVPEKVLPQEIGIIQDIGSNS